MTLERTVAPGRTGAPGTSQPVEPSRTAGDVLHRIALTVNSSLDIRGVLETLVKETLQAIPADRCNLFLLDEEGKRLLPTLAVAHREDETLWHRFRTMEPIDLMGAPERRAVFQAGRAIAIDDMAASPLIPQQIVEVFGSRSAIITPLVAVGEPIGVLSLDWMTPGRGFDEADVHLLEAIGAYAALAIRNARLYNGLEGKARSLGRLVEVAATLTSPPSTEAVPELVARTFEELFGTAHCSINLLERHDGVLEVHTMAVRGHRWMAGQRSMLDSVDPGELARVSAKWAHRAEPIVYTNLSSQHVLAPGLIPDGIASVALFPLVHPGGLLGAIIAGFPSPAGPGADALPMGQALADLAASAIGRARLDESLRRRLQQLEVLARLGDVVAGTANLGGAVRALNRALPGELSIEIQSISVANPAERAAVGGDRPAPDERDAIARWRAQLAAGDSLRPIRAGSLALVPVALHHRVHGALVVKVGSASTRDDGLLLAIGAGCAEVIVRAWLQRRLASTERTLAIGAERERLARDLHDSVGQLLVGIGMRIAGFIDEAPDAMWRDRLDALLHMADRGNRDIRNAIASLLFLQVRREGLLASLRQLGSRFEATTGIAVRTRLAEGGPPLAADVEDVVFRVAHEALMNVERHSRASVVTINLTRGEAGVLLTVQDDGVGLSQRDPFSCSGHFGLQGIRGRVEECGGRLRVKSARPRGVRVEARLPAGGGR